MCCCCGARRVDNNRRTHPRLQSAEATQSAPPTDEGGAAPDADAGTSDTDHAEKPEAAGTEETSTTSNTNEAHAEPAANETLSDTGLSTANPLPAANTAGIIGVPEIVSTVTQTAEPNVIALAATTAAAAAATETTGAGKQQGGAPLATPAAAPPPTAASASPPQAPVLPVQPIPLPGDSGVDPVNAPNTPNGGTTNPGLSLTAPLTALLDGNAPHLQPAAQGAPVPTINAPSSATTPGAGPNAAAQQPTAQATPNVDVAALLTTVTPQTAPEPASMAQTMVAAQLARSGGEGLAANSGATSVDPLPPVTGVANVSQPTSATAVTQTAAMHRPSAQPTPADQVAVQIQRAVANGDTRINIRLHPASLGRVDVDLEIGKDGRVLAMVTAEKAETLEMLQRDTKVLERALQDAGLDANPDSLSFNLFGEKDTAGSDDKDKTGNSSNDALSQPDGTTDTEQSPAMRIASDRALDIRV